MGKRGSVKLTDHQSKVIEPPLPSLRRERTDEDVPWIESLSILDGIFVDFSSGARWRIFPANPRLTWHRRFQQWAEFGAMTESLRVSYVNKCQAVTILGNIGRHPLLRPLTATSIIWVMSSGVVPPLALTRKPLSSVSKYCATGPGCKDDFISPFF